MNRSQPRSLRSTFLLSIVASLALGVSVTALAVGTRQLLIDDAASFSAGELKGAAVLSTGALVPSLGTRRIALQDVALAKSFARASNGDVFIGTGNNGRVLRLQNDQVTTFAQTGQLLVNALVLGPDGTLYAGTLPNGAVFAIAANGEVRELVRLPGAQHVWALRYDVTRKVLFAATGPEGKVFTIDAAGRAEVFYDADAANHVMDIALDGQGGVYAALSDEALLMHVAAPGRAEVVYDFPGTEITAIALSNGVLAVAANTFPKAGASTTSSTTTNSTSGTTPATPSTPAASRGVGKGQLWRVTSDGRARKLIDVSDAHITALQWSDEHTVYAALGHEGRVLRVHDDGTHAVWLDVDERQVLAFDLAHAAPLLLTGDAGAIYRIGNEAGAQPQWTSKTLDANFRSRWGELTWRGNGSVKLQTRSGNTEKPDASWSPWSAALTSPGPIRSPAARFLQVRATLDLDANTIIHAVTAHYLQDNQNATVRDVQVRAARSGRKANEATTSANTDSASTQQKITWEVDNPDEDALRYRVSFRAESQSVWRAIQRESDVLIAKELAWDTSSVPDGYYRVRVEASDENANPEAATLRTSTQSEPFLIDNHAPQVVGLKLERGSIEGRAVDAMGPISKLEYALDGQPWKLFFPTDDLLDTANEAFALTLAELPAGPHIVAVRATDAAGNIGSSEVSTR